MSVIRSRPRKNFTVLPNELLRDPMTPHALGVLVFLLSHPSDWVISREYIQRHFDGCGRDRVRSIFVELEHLGYLRRAQPINPNGKFAAVEYAVFDDKENTVGGFSGRGENDGIEPENNDIFELSEKLSPKLSTNCPTVTENQRWKTGAGNPHPTKERNLTKTDKKKDRTKKQRNKTKECNKGMKQKTEQKTEQKTAFTRWTDLTNKQKQELSDAAQSYDRNFYYELRAHFGMEPIKAGFENDRSRI